MSGSRFRRGTAHKAGGLSQLGELMKSAKESTAPAPGPTVLPFGILPNDDDLTCVWKAMSDCKGRTPTELVAALANLPDQIDPDDVEGLLRILATQGYATIQSNRNEEPIYTLKKGAAMSIGQRERDAHKLRGPQSDLQGLDPKGTIDLSEGIMVCLWKVMSDYKGRTQEQVFEILGAYGVNKEVAKDAFIRAKVVHKWFDWHGSGYGQPFRMKKHIKMPEPQNVDPATLRQKMTPGAIRLPTPASAPLVTLAPAGGQKGRHHIFHENDQPRMDTQANSQFQQEPSPPPQTTVETLRQDVADEIKKVQTVQFVPTKHDSLDVAIWKVMSDFKHYSAKEVGLLLEDLGHKIDTTRIRMSQLFLQDGFHWFTREKRKATTGSGNNEYIYQLNDNIPMPGTTLLAPQPQPAEPAAEKAPEPAAQANLPLTDDKEDDMKKAAATVQGATAMGTALLTAQQNAASKPAEQPAPQPAPPAPVQPTATASKDPEPILKPIEPTNGGAAKNDDNVGYFKLADLPDTELLGFQVKVRNSLFSFKQADQLTRELMKAGFGEGKNSTTGNTLLTAAFRIGNATFTSDELETLTRQLLESGFGID